MAAVGWEMWAWQELRPPLVPWDVAWARVPGGFHFRGNSVHGLGSFLVLPCSGHSGSGKTEAARKLVAFLGSLQQEWTRDTGCQVRPERRRWSG